MNDPQDMDVWARRLEALGLGVRRQVVESRRAGAELAAAVGVEGGDTIFAIDRLVEPVIERHIESWPEACKPLLLIAEGMGPDGRRVFAARAEGTWGDLSAIRGLTAGTPQPPAVEQPRFCLLIDPIDGTRNIMYDKRAAWFLAALTPGRRADGGAPTLADTLVSVMVELPTSKAGWADTYVAQRGQPTVGKRQAVADGTPTSPISIHPSAATTLRDGWAQVSNFFPGTKVLAAELMERIATAAVGEADTGGGGASIFDDQYLSTGGQMVELMLGHDRFCCDLRPLFHDILERQGRQAARGLECHPYDCAGMLVAEQAGVIIADGLGRALDAPLSVHHGVHWCGYANQALRERIAPVIVEWFGQKGTGSGK